MKAVQGRLYHALAAFYVEKKIIQLVSNVFLHFLQISS